MTLRVRLLLIIVTAGVLMAAVIAALVLTMGGLRKTTEDMHRLIVLPINELHQASGRYGAIQETLKGLSSGAFPSQESREQLSEAVAYGRDWWARYALLPLEAREQTMAGELGLLMSEFESVLTPFFSASPGARPGPADLPALQRLESLARQIVQGLDRLVEQRLAAARSADAAVQAAVRRQTLVSVAGIVLGVLIVLFALHTFFFHIIRPINALTSSMTTLAGGELEQAIPYTDRQDELGALATTLSAFREHAWELRDARTRTEDAMRARSQFLATMSHEIRTPMSGVQSMVGLLEQTELTSEQAEIVRIVRESAAALVGVINDILDFSRIEAGKLTISSAPFSVSSAVYGVAELLTARAEEKGLDLLVRMDLRLPDQLVGDSIRFRQILMNLAGNAVKFTERGEVILRVRRADRLGDARVWLRGEVQDSGPGLPSDHPARSFQPFSQRSRDAAHAVGGSGLGLSICKQLCDLMGGTLGVDSAPGRGSLFWFELPLEPGESSGRIVRPGLGGTRVWMAGFAGEFGEILCDYLRHAGMEPERYPNLAAVRQQLVDTGPAAAQGLVILTAHRLPDGSGLTLAQEIAAGPHRERVHVVLVAPRAQRTGLTDAQRSALAAMLTRPVRPESLMLAISQALGRAKGDTSSVSVAAPVRYQPPSVEEARAAGALVLVADDNALNRLVILEMLRHHGCAVEIVADADQALAEWRKGGCGFLITDFHMPGMDGLELAMRIRSEEKAAGGYTPIMLLTADVMSGLEQRCRQAGVDGYMAKPIEREPLYAALERFVPQTRALRRERKEARRPKHRPARIAANPQVLDLEVLSDIFGGLTAPARAILAKFTKDLLRSASAVSVPLEAGEWAAARSAAHALKGAALTVGANGVGKLAGRIQDALDAQRLEEARNLWTGIGEAIGALDHEMQKLMSESAESEAG